MVKALKRVDFLILIGIPTTLILFLFFLTKTAFFHQNSDQLSIAITLDLVLTIPILFYLLGQKRGLSWIKVAPVVIIGFLTASLILPFGEQALLINLRSYLLPVFEIAIMATVVFRVRQTIISYKKAKVDNPDFYTAFQKAAAEIVPGKLSKLVAGEIALIYYGFLNWEKRRLAPNEFSIHKRSGITSVLGVFIFLIIIESTVIHLLLERWNPIVAWILTGLSGYSILQIFGILRTLPKRPIILEPDVLKLRYGTLAESEIPLKYIQKVEMSRKRFDENESLARSFSPLKDLESHNVIIHLTEPSFLTTMYSLKKKPFILLALHIDDPKGFKTSIEEARRKLEFPLTNL